MITTGPSLQTLTVLAQNTGILPPNYNLAEAQADLANIDTLRPRFARLRALMEKADDTEVALGSDVMSAALEGYAQLKVSGKGAGPRLPLTLGGNHALSLDRIPSTEARRPRSL